MSEKYLNSKASFSCNCSSIAKFTLIGAGNPLVKIHGNGVMTESASIINTNPTPPQCQRTPNPATGNPPGPCTCPTHSFLTCDKKSNLRVSAKKERVLLEGCSIYCPLGGKITATPPPYR